MPRLAERLTDGMIKDAHKTTAKQLTDGACPGLYLKLRANKAGQHQWRFDFRSPERIGADLKGVRDTLLLGFYPEVTLKRAHEKVAAAKALIDRGTCPKGAMKKAAEAAQAKEAAREATKAAQERAQAIAEGKEVAALPDSFRAVAEAFHATRWKDEPPAGWKQKIGKGHATKWINSMKTYVFPVIGDKAFPDITPGDITKIVLSIEDQGKKQMAFVVRVYIEQLFKYAINVLELCQVSPMGKVLASGAITKRPKSKPHPSQTTPNGAAYVIQAIDSHDDETQRECFQMMAMVWQRPGNVSDMEWSELDLEHAQWIIPARKLKARIEDKETGEDHVVPLPKQAVKQLKKRQLAAEPGCPWVYPAPQRTCGGVSQTTRSRVFKQLGIAKHMKPHGFRAMGRTMLREVHGFHRDALEAHLAHKNGEANGQSYDRATHLTERTKAMQVWADYLDKLRGANVKTVRLAA